MSVLIYEGVNLVNPADPAQVNMKALEVTAVFAMMRGNKRVHASSEFSVSAGTWGLALQKAWSHAEEIESLSRGVLVKITTQVGKYIKDATLLDITSTQRSAKVVYKNVDGSKSTKVKIPFLRSDVTEDQIDTVLKALNPCLLMKNPAGTGILLYDTNIMSSKSTFQWDREPAGLVTSANVVDAGTDGHVGQIEAEPDIS